MEASVPIPATGKSSEIRGFEHWRRLSGPRMCGSAVHRANTTYFHDSDTPGPATPPAGFSGVLTRPQWKGVIDFSHATHTKIVTSFATSPGTRDARGVWTPTEANKVLSYTRSIGGSIAAAEFMNEPTYAEMGGTPKGYDAAAYGRDIAVFRPFMMKAAPSTLILGPGGVGEGNSADADWPRRECSPFGGSP